MNTDGEQQRNEVTKGFSENLFLLCCLVPSLFILHPVCIRVHPWLKEKDGSTAALGCCSERPRSELLRVASKAPPHPDPLLHFMEERETDRACAIRRAGPVLGAASPFIRVDPCSSVVKKSSKKILPILFILSEFRGGTGVSPVESGVPPDSGRTRCLASKEIHS
jgi:hypothetical protein